MSERVLPVRLIREREAAAGAELGVWRGARAWAILDQTLVAELLLVDPWSERRNRFETVEAVPERMPLGQYHCTMGEPHQDQAALDRMAASVQTQAKTYGDRARVLRLPAVEAAALIPDRTLDFVLWDAVHLGSAVTADLDAWRPKLRPGGWLLGDGFLDRGVREAIFACVSPRWNLTVTGDVWMLG